MRRKLSSAMTPIYKFVFPVVIVAFCLNAAFGLGVQKGWPIILVMTVMLLGWYFFVGRLLVVHRGDTSLYVSNYRREIQIPLSDVTRITENKLLNTRDVTIHLARPSAFGSRITFMPEVQFFLFSRDHPVVSELSQSVALAREAERAMIEIVKAPTAEVIALLDELNAALAGSYSEEQRHGLPVDRLFQPNIRFFIARLDGEAVACGGIGFYDGFAELKRMYSKPSVRGRGVAKKLLARLEAEAIDAGQTLVRIETGVYQLEAMRFYERASYRRCEAFGPYATMAPAAIETSVFYEKRL
jgi:putative acetyltransferase